MSFLGKLDKLPRELLFLLLFASIIIPIIHPIGFSLTISERTTSFYNIVNALKPGSRVLMCVDVGPDAYPEPRSAFVAIEKHLVLKGAKMYYASFYPLGPATYPQIMEDITPFLSAHDYKYGRDYVILGFFAGDDAAMASFGSNLRGLISVDYYRTPIGQLTVMNGVEGIKDFDLVVIISPDPALSIGYVRQWQSRYGTVIAWTGLSIVGTALEPYYPGQIKAMIYAARQGAEYELLIKQPWLGVSDMDVMTTTNLFILVMIGLGNIAYVYRRAKGQEKKRA